MESDVGLMASNPAPDRDKETNGNASIYPLSASLTLRVINYLNAFRLFIGILLTAAFLFGLLVVPGFQAPKLLTTVFLITYVISGLGLLYMTRSQRLECFALARLALLADTLFLSLFYVLFGGGQSGLGVLLVFICASAAILLPLRMALFIASLATIVIIGEAFSKTVAEEVQTENLVSAGFYGITNFLTAILIHLLAFWARDYRLIAERQQRHLIRLEQINELIIRRMRGGVLAVDQAGTIQMMNESAWFLLGNPSTSDRVLEQISPELSDAMNRWQEDPAKDTMPLTLNASQAQVVPKFVMLPGGQGVRVLIFLEDNDVVAQRALELSNSTLAKLSSSIAHEIRNPLAASSHAAQLLQESATLDEADHRLVQIITGQSKRMNDIVENILQLSRREKSRPDLIDLGPWLADLADEFTSSMSGRDLEVARELGTAPSLAMFDRGQLHQALWKLMENAVHHGEMEDEKTVITLRLARNRGAGYCVISVENPGPGIPDRHIEHIFEPFYTTHRQGSGLGLYIAKQLCEANQAELTVDSTPNWKTRFHIRLALSAETTPELDEAEST